MAYTDIDKSDDYFNTKLYTGNGGTQNITGLDFAPDWVWLKSRSNGNYHNLSDTVRGVNKQLYSNDTSAEATKTTVLTAFNSDGFTLGSESDVNGSGRTFASWNWLAGGSASSNTDGSITSNVSASTTSGFSIVSYTGTGSNATVGHGLGVAPKLIIAKSRDAAENWVVFHKSLNSTGAGTYIYLNTTAAAGGGGSNTSIFNNTAPTSSVFSIGTDGNINNSGDDYIAYCFNEVKGYSKFGSYTGNGNADGNFVYLGFKPAWVLVKNSSLSGENWVMLDNKRDPKNPTNLALFSNLSNAEGGTYPFDFVSNGFKIRDSSAAYNRSGDNFIYMAFAESPFVTSTGVPATAR